MADPNEIISQIQEDAIPSNEERERMRDNAEELTSRISEHVEENGIEIEGITQTGSTARGTWVSGDRDIDLFIEFPTSMDKEELEEIGLSIGQEILPNPVVEYAAHPYTKGKIGDFDVDIVPCFAIEEGEELQSAVDRTPHHTRWLRDNLTDNLKDEVVIAKKFLKGTGVYGSDVSTQGFSGLLTELMVLEHNGFIPFLESAANWEPHSTKFDIENHQSSEFDAPLVVIDPVDSDRNVAANLSIEKFSELQLHAREFLENPSIEFFRRDNEFNAEKITMAIERRNTTPFTLKFPREELSYGDIDDRIFPQLIRTMDSVHSTLEDRGFTVIRSQSMMNDEWVVGLFELESQNLSSIVRVEGPPVSIRGASNDFMDKYKDEEAVFGPFIEGGRLFVEKEREFTTVRDFIGSDKFINSVSFGPSIEESFDQLPLMTVFNNSDPIEELLEIGLGPELSEYFEGV